MVFHKFACCACDPSVHLSVPSICLFVVVVVRLPGPMEGNWVTPIFRSLQNCQFHHRRLESFYIYIILSTTVSHFWTLRMSLFLQGLPFCIHFHFCRYTLHVCYVFNVNLTDYFDDRRSQCRAAPTDTNPKNFELARPQSVTATRLDQLVYSPNYYIQIFRLNLFARSED